MATNEWYGLLGIIVVIAGAFFLFFSNRNIQSLQKSKKSVSYPLILQAHERMVLFLNRISPQNILTRINFSGKSAMELQQMVLQEIRAEFDHNAAQQLYIKDEVWSKIKLAADTTSAELIHAISENANLDNKQIVVKILSQSGSASETRIADALKAIKDEVQKNF